MRILALAVVSAVCAYAQSQSSPLSFYIDPSNGGSPTNQLTPLPSTYQFADTPVGSSSSVVLRVVNSSSAPVDLQSLIVGNAPNSLTPSSSFQLTGFDGSAPPLAPQAFKIFTVTFTPASAGAAVGYLQASTDTAVISVSTLQGNGTPSSITLVCNGNTIAANTTIEFGSVSTTSSSTMQCTVTNGTSASVTAALESTQNNTTPFSATGLPVTVAAGSSANFSLTFAPGNGGAFATLTNLDIGTSVYPLDGTGAGPAPDVAPLEIVYTDSTGVRLTAQSATPVDFGQIVGGSNTLTFTVTNPSTNFDAVTIPAVTVSGAAFSLSLTASPIPPCVEAVSGSNSLQPGQCMNFQVVFSPGAVATFNGTLAIGGNQFNLTGQNLAPVVSQATWQVDVQPLTSAQQAHLTITISPAPIAALAGTLSMQFTPSVNNVSSDPAIEFVGSNSQNVSVSVPAGSQTVTYNGQTPITFQTGTTAGTIQFSLQLVNSPALTQSFTIAPAPVSITSITAVQESPNLVVTLNGYDNTYSAGQLSFVFSTTAFGNITVTADATSAFHQYFFTNDQTGGAFSLQATFPVTGDVTQVTSVAATVSNSAGQTTVNQAFQ